MAKKKKMVKKKAANKKASSVKVQQTSKLRKLLNNEETAGLACELVIAMAVEEPDVFKKLLDGCCINNGALLPSRLFRSNHEWRTRAFLRIVSNAPETGPVSPSKVLSIDIQSDMDGSFGTTAQLNKVKESILRSLPEEIGRFNQLRTLSLTDTLVESIPESIGCLEQLQKLILRYEHSSYFGDLIGDRAPLHLIPSSICSLAKLEELDLSGSGITTLPENIGDLKSLKRLSLSGCLLTTLPDSIGLLENLEVLELSSCPLSKIPDSIGRLKQLKSLIISARGWNYKYNLADIPESIGDLTALETLDLSGTKVTCIPKTISRLSRLKHVSLPKTITHIPFEFGLLKLEALELDDDYDGKVMSKILLDVCKRAYVQSEKFQETPVLP